MFSDYKSKKIILYRKADSFVKKIDTILEVKEKEIMTV